MEKKLLIFCLMYVMVNFAQGQNGMIGDGFGPGWANPSQIQSFGNSAGGTRIRIANPSGTGNRFFRLVRNWGMSNPNTEYGPFGCTDVNWTSGVGSTYFNLPVCGSGAFFINCPNTTDNYVFKTPGADNNDNNNDFVYFRVQGAIRTITSVSRTVGSIHQGQSVTITANLNDVFATGQAAFLRYTTNAFSSSTVVKMTGSGTTYSASIPAQSEGTTVSYYVFTSGDVAGVSHSEADLYTINLNNNGGLNYEYTVLAPLPVEFMFFTATPQPAANHLAWATATERNNSHFEVERSADSRLWKVIGEVAGVGDSQQEQRYSFVDAQPLPGRSYYRLRQVDFDGQFDYSTIALAERSDKGALRAFPNPAASGEGLRLSWPADWPAAELLLYASDGRLLRRWPLTAGQTEQPLADALLPSGIYLARLVGPQAQELDVIKLWVE
jgi:hypothetical protein